MYAIAVYDVEAKRCPKMLKLCRKFLNHVQYSVFEGEMTESQAERLKIEALRIMRPEEGDSLIIFSAENRKWMGKEIVGADRRSTDSFV